MLCTCDDDEDEHGQDPEFPGSTACNVEGCDCIAFEAAEYDDDDNDGNND